MKLKIKRLSDTAKLPEKAHSEDAGFDIFADETIVLNPSYVDTVSAGIAIRIPTGYYGRLKGRSGLTSKKPLRVHEGTIDSGYTGPIKIMCQSEGAFYEIKKGDKIAQLIIQEVPAFEIEEVDELEETTRGSNGFGSTGV